MVDTPVSEAGGRKARRGSSPLLGIQFSTGDQTIVRHRMLLLFTVGYIYGIIVSANCGIKWWWAAVVGCIALLFISIRQHVSPLPIILIGVALGILRFCSYFPPGWSIETYAGPAPVTVVGTVCSDPQVGRLKTSFLVSTLEVVTHSGTVLTHGTTDVLVHGAALSTFDDPRFGDKVQVAGLLQRIVPATNPGEFDWRSRLLHRGISGELIVQRPDGALIVNSPGPAVVYQDWSKQSDKRLEALCFGHLPTEEASLLSGILFGDRARLGPELQQKFVATGTAHILATAGLHVGILAMILSWSLRLLPLPRKVCAALVILLLWAFACVAGGRPAVVRAVAAATVYYVAYIFERIPDLPTTISVAGLGILILEPPVLFESDFQLSFVTVVGLALLMPFWEFYWKPVLKTIEQSKVRRICKWSLELAGLSCIAQLCSAPLIAYYYDQISLLALPTNLLVVPLLFVIIPTAVAGIAISLALPFCSKFIFGDLLHPLLWTVIHTVNWFAFKPMCAISISPPPVLLIVAGYVVGYGFALYSQPKDPEAMTAQKTGTA
jgi:competence protein ComEC